MIADCFVLWRISDPQKYTQTLSAQKSNAEYRIDTIVYNSLKNVISSLSQEEVISGRDGELAMMIGDNIGDTLTQYGITLLAVETKSLDLPDENKAAVYERMISERNNIAATFQAEGKEEAKEISNKTKAEIIVMQSEADAKAEETIAKGEAEYMRILSNAYNDPEKADFDWLYRHIEHFLSLGGEKVVALGSDFDGTHVPECLSSVEKNADFYEYLLKKNLNEDLVRDIFFENANRVFQEYVL